jgi:hypothetical protein
MLDNAKRGRFAYPAINIAGLEGLNATLEGFAEARSDGIVQVSSGGGAHASGPAVADMALGAQVLAEAAHRLAERHDVLIALHTDHCHPKNLEPFVDPLIEASEARVARGEPPLFNSHMFDGSELSLAENLAISKRYLERLAPILAMDPPAASHVLVGSSHGDQEILAAIHESFDRLEYVPDPHTAVGLLAAREVPEAWSAAPRVVLGTAHPGKFPEAVGQAVGQSQPVPPGLRAALSRSPEYHQAPPNLDALRPFLPPR